MKTRRIAVLATTVTIAMLGTAGCGGSTQANADGKVTLVLANSQWLDALRGKNLWAAVKEYEKVNPKVTLKQEAIPSADIDTKLPTELGAGQGPDIMMVQDLLFWTVRTSLLPLDKAVSGSANLNATNDGGVIGGKRLGVAWQRAAYATIYNKTILAKSGVNPPKTVPELIQAAQKAHQATGAIGFTERHQMNEFANWYKDFQNWVYGYGGGWVKDGKLTIDTPENVAAVQAFKDVYDAKIIPFGDDFPTQRNRFKSGGVAFSIDNSGGTLNIATGAQIKPTDLGASALPFPHPGAHQQIFLAVNKNTSAAKQKAALDFVKWFVGSDAQKAMRGASGPDVLATDVPIDPGFLKTNPWAQTFYDLAASSRSGLIEGHEAQTSQIMRPIMEAVERVLTANADPHQELARVQQQLQGQFG